ncbi:snare associated Golgi protein-domain-containing protein [Lactarius deliciosus]|nr:snare associated Golgi protein-domain-containing protein [Lactarius deliciosus]
MSSPYPAYGQQPGANDPYLYPPNGSSAPYSLDDSSSTVHGKYEFASNRISRTPSPTPSEAAELARKGLFDWKSMASWRFWFRREWLWYYVIAVILTVITLFITVFHQQIVDKLTPMAQKVKNRALDDGTPRLLAAAKRGYRVSAVPNSLLSSCRCFGYTPLTDRILFASLPGGWSIPIAILFVISFPPLFGHEIVAILCGVVWGLWIGFAIVAAGTFLGELGNFYAFKYCCRARGEKLEKTNMQYGCLARVVREGGFKIALVARFSAIPGHFTTAVFATCGMGVWTFALAAFLSLPKQLATVYIGVIIESTGKKETVAQRIASYSVITITTIVTIVAAWYIYRELNRVKPAVIYERRKARQAKMELGASYYNNNQSSVSAFNPNPSDSDIPLQPYDPERDAYGGPSNQHQQWDETGRAIGYSPDPRLHAPRPRPPSFSPSALYASPAAAAAATTSQDPEDEWTNARTPKTARPPDPAPAPGTYTPHASSPDPISTFPPPPQSPRSARRRTRSPGLSTEAQYVTYHPEHFTGNSAAGAAQRQDPYSPEPTPPRAFSPPPSYR